MSEMPEEIYVEETGGDVPGHMAGVWDNQLFRKSQNTTYIRSDIHDRLKAENERLRGELHFIAEYPYKFGQHVQHLKERATKALKGGE
jgi:hypothetical protein